MYRSRLRTGAAAAALAGLLAACAGDEDRQRQAVSDLGAWLDQELQLGPEGQPWEEALGLSLEPAAVERLVLRRNPDAVAALERWVGQLERAPQARGLPDPWLRYRYSSMFRMHTVELMQEVPYPEKLLADGRAALAMARVGEAQAAQVRNALRERTGAALGALHAARRTLELVEQSLADLERFVELARTKYAAGAASQSDVLRAELERDGLRAAREGAVRDALLATSALNALLDRRPDAALGPVRLPPLPVPEPLAGLLQRAQERHPDLSAARARLEYGREMVGHADLAWVPDLVFGGAYVRDFGADEDELELTAGLSLPVWGWKNQAHRREAQAVCREAEAEVRGARARVLDEVVQAAGRLQAAAAQERILREQALPTAARNVAVTEAAYVAGQVDLLALIDAQRQVLGQRIEQARLEGEGLAAEAALRRATGETGEEVRGE